MSEDVPHDAPERSDPTYLWRDMLQLHSAFPLHCLVGGGERAGAVPGPGRATRQLPARPSPCVLQGPCRGLGRLWG